MSRYVLDTDILSLYQHGHPRIGQRLREHAPAEVVISIISVEEQLSGWYRRLRGAKTAAEQATAYQHLAATVTFLGGLPILAFSEAAIARFEQLKTLKLNVGPMDLRIAAIVLEEEARLVTRNTRDFGRVPNLRIEDWTV